MNDLRRKRGSLSLVRDADGEGEIEHVPALIPAGNYAVKFTHWWTGVLFGRRPKLGLCFEVCDIGEYLGTPLTRWYNVKLKSKRTGRNGDFKAGWGSDVVREYGRLIGMPHRNDRIALSRYGGLLINAEVRTVGETRAQEKLPPELQYSVIARLVSVEAGRRAA